MSDDPRAEALIIFMVALWIGVTYALYFYAPWVPHWQRTLLSMGVAFVGASVLILLLLRGIL
jgi:hypothetical protein